MVFTPPSWVPPMLDPPDTISVPDFVKSELYGRYSVNGSRPMFTCGITGTSYTASEAFRRTDFLSRGLRKALRWNVNEGTEWDRVVAIFSYNTVDYILAGHAVHKLSGIVTPASFTHSPQELQYQLRLSGSKAIFTCIPLLETALQAASAVGIPSQHVFILPLPGAKADVPHITVEELINQGQTLPDIASPPWVKGQGSRQTAYLCFSSGTSGLPKAVMVSHRNVIANTLQTATFDRVGRGASKVTTQVAAGILPFSHIFGLVNIAHVAMYRGDELVVLPRFDFAQLLKTVEKFKIEQLSIVPPILIQIISRQDECRRYDLSSVRHVFTGAAPLGSETMDRIQTLYPNWKLGQGYGLTEASPSVLSTSEHDPLPGSAGSLLPYTKAKLISLEGNEVTKYETRGELLIQSPSITLGYLNDEKENSRTFVWHNDGRWLKTGDEVIVRKSALGYEHFVVVDRIKELIKVKGHQVAPAELEAHILDHPYVSDCAIIGVRDERSGEVPKAFIVKSADLQKSIISDDDARKAIHKHVEEHKARHKWLRGGIEFVELIPKSPSGKILRRLIRDAEAKKQRPPQTKL
ncbi:unnamed protein product [Clonostachys byssicola]|uniref:Phenylacetyl-CoA ligase n=1 Tax=Clonostachys byssicola TaxID=160290 RepID=A0A9N9U2T4_9HYPO|nr:unnamed protein product [Clonostachys byssicola]